VHKRAWLDGPDTGVDRRFAVDGFAVSARRATRAQRRLAERVLASVPCRRDGLLYARVDMIPGRDGEPLLSELELIEPNLYLDRGPGSLERLVDAIAAMLPWSSCPAFAQTLPNWGRGSSISRH
jgi:hypothetical protein